MPGPIPMRSDDLARPEYDANRKGNIQLKKGKSIPSEPKAADPEWETLASEVYTSMMNSGMSAFFEASDWAMLYLLCDHLSDLRKTYKETGRLPAIIFQTVMRELNSLGMSEGERRRMRIELEAEVADDSEEATITVIDSYREKLAQAVKDRKGAA